MQCRCRKIVIIRRVVDNMTDHAMREICRLLMAGLSLNAVCSEMKLPVAVFEMFIEEIRRLFIVAGLEIRGV